jgi:hypothetical protein
MRKAKGYRLKAKAESENGKPKVALLVEPRSPAEAQRR